ncbi:hypothetical protein C8R43DRAFT_942676 [Mycena crocata]|nr:hypothetical protein C8R43DRAFT_942676 [Mycena crocata]
MSLIRVPGTVARKLTLYLTMAEGILYAGWRPCFPADRFPNASCAPPRMHPSPRSHRRGVRGGRTTAPRLLNRVRDEPHYERHIFRCYAIRNFQRKIIATPLLSTLAVAGLVYFDSGRLTAIVIITFLFNLSIAVSLFTTIMLMGLSVGRIWWLARRARDVLGRRVTVKYHTVVAMIISLESGALYCLGGIAFIIVACREASSTNPAITSGAVLGQLVGIAPTILAVRVGLGKVLIARTAIRRRCKHTAVGGVRGRFNLALFTRLISLNPGFLSRICGLGEVTMMARSVGKIGMIEQYLVGNNVFISM